MRRCCRRHVRAGVDHDDIESAGDELLCRCAQSWDSKRDFPSLLATALARRAVDLMRRQRCMQFGLNIVEFPARQPRFRLEIQELVHRALFSMSPQQRFVVMQRGEGSTLAQIGQLLDLSKRDVLRQWHHAITAARIALHVTERHAP